MLFTKAGRHNMRTNDLILIYFKSPFKSNIKF